MSPFQRLVSWWLTAQTVHGLRMTCVTSGITTGSNALASTECYDGSGWEVIPSLTLADVNAGQVGLNLGSVSCVLAGAPTVVVCTNSSASWMNFPTLPQQAKYSGLIYGGNWIGVTNGQYTPQSFMKSTVPQSWVTDTAQLNLAWSTAPMSNLGPYSSTMNLNGTSCLFGAYNIQSGSSCLDQSSGTMQWVPGPAVTSPRYAATALHIAGQWCAAGGLHTGTVLNSIECIDETESFQTGTFVVAPYTLPTSVTLAANITIHGLSCLAGGGVGATVTAIADVVCANVSEVDNTVQWLIMPSLTAPRRNPASWTLDDTVPTFAPTTSPTTSPTASPTSAPTTSPTAPPTSAPTAPPTTPPTSMPTISPTTLTPTLPRTLAPTRTSSPTALAGLGDSKKPLSPGGVTGIVIACVIVLGLCLGLPLCWWWRTKRAVVAQNKNQALQLSATA